MDLLNKLTDILERLQMGRLVPDGEVIEALQDAITKIEALMDEADGLQ